MLLNQMKINKNIFKLQRDDMSTNPSESEWLRV